jgi:hypothetical protein
MKRAISSSNNTKSRMKNPKKLQIKTNLNSNRAKDSKSTKKIRRKRKRDIFSNKMKKSKIRKKMISTAFATLSKMKRLKIQRKNQK